ncbi:probable phospholipid-transporting ATPase IM isoform X5 [Delphinapterus leucas]|uniref:Phospholipid-transporting ATPase n=1 Tax=Delphinapterus leucas TaxID=9749 RepID=A0A2Y9PA09_DELLE|nr:probable phospholipid-transporting ATPase IM isoform X5 [Delphinapterus leucas]
MLCSKKKSLEVERIVKANDREYNEKYQYTDNRIHTCKYNILTFLPINLFEQFQRVANVYFLFLLILQLIPEISSLTWFTTIVPLVLVVTMTAVKDATDDYFRHKSDNQVNNRQSEVLIDSKLQNEKWMNVKVGDIIKLENNQFVAADLLLLSSSEPHGLCYIETAELDGETNLKVRHALSVTSGLGADISRLAKFDGIVVCEAPNNKLDKFTGVLSWKGSEHSLNNEKIILRGCVLRNTSWCFGMVIFAGPDTKLMQNSGKTKFKRTSIDRLMNTLVLWIFGFLICLGIILAIGNSIWENQVGDQFRTFLFWNEGEKNSVFSGFLTFWSYIIILNTVVPISLYVSVEVIRLGHSYFINWDRKMYYSGKATPAQARTTTLNEELGQIEYVFSDKTGTLTENIMTFKKCSINGRIYGEVHDVLGQKTDMTKKKEAVGFSVNPEADRTFQFFDHHLMESIKMGDPKVHEFLRLLALCHTVMSEENSAGELIYQVQSPDEGALVTAAKNLGFIFKSRTPETITIEELGTLVTYQLLAFLDFNNFRKRMSVIVRNPEGQIKLYSKGADTILFERLHPSNEDLLTLTSDHLSEFAGEGLRTLAIAYRDLDDKYFKEWHKMLEDANAAVDKRDERIEGLYEEIERDLMTVYDQWFITLFNIVYTSLPVLAMGIFDQDVNDQNSMDCPQLYKPGQLNLLFNKHKFFICVAHGIYTSLALFFIPYGAFYNVAGEDGQHIADYQSFAVTMATSLVIVVSVQIALDTSYWTIINHVFVWGSIATYFSILFTMHSNGLFGIFPRQFPFVGNARHSLTQKCIWLVILLTIVASVMPVVAFRFLKVDLFPTLSDQKRLYTSQSGPLCGVYIIWMLHLTLGLLCLQIRQWQKAQKKARPLRSRKPQTRRSSSRRSGYAFAHQEGYGELITSGKNMRAKNPPPTSGLEKTLYNSTSWIENLCKKTTDTVSSFSQDKTVKL